MKYNIGEVYYLRKDYRILCKNGRVEIIIRRKRGKDTLVDVKDINNRRVDRIPSNILRKHPSWLLKVSIAKVWKTNEQKVLQFLKVQQKTINGKPSGQQFPNVFETFKIIQFVSKKYAAVLNDGWKKDPLLRKPYKNFCYRIK